MAIVASGDWWELNNSALVIHCTGNMPTVNNSAPPWYRYRDQITSVAIRDGVTDIMNYAFQGCTELVSVTIPDSVISIGECAFRYDSVLSDVYYGGTQAQWNAITIGNENDPLESATIYYSGSEDEDTPAVVIPAIPLGNLGNPLAAVVRTLNLVIQYLNGALADIDNAGTITEIIMNGVSKGTSGVVNLGTVLTQHQDISGKADASTVSTLIGSDTGKSVRTIANEELASQLIPQNAQEALDTLQEISAWIQSHPGEVAAINRKLTLGTSNGTEYATVKAYVEAVTNGLITLSALSANVTGAGNAVTGVSYDNTTGAFSFAKEQTFLTEHQSLANYATKAELPTKVSDLTNDSGYLTQHQDISGKVDKETGKGLSTNDYTTAEKTKLSGIPADANHTTIDATLSNAGQAADAKSTGDNIYLLRELINGIDADIYRTASGNPATFADAKAANVKALSITLTPTQSGSGNPSLTNIRPISGVSSVSVTRTGKNLLYVPDGVTERNGVTFTSNGGAVTVTGTPTGQTFHNFNAPNLPPGNYIMSGSSSKVGFYVRVQRGGGDIEYVWNMAGHSADSLVINEGDSVVSSSTMVAANHGTLNDTLRPMIRLASDTDPTFEVYQGQTVSVALTDGSNPLTVYGGTLNVTTGQLTVTHKEFVPDPNGQYAVDRADSYPIIKCLTPLTDARVDNDDNYIGWICNRLRSVTGNASYALSPASGDYVGIGSSKTIRFKSLSNFTTVAEFKAWLAENPLQVVYELATPLTYPLTPQQLATLHGYNTVSSDAGSVSVTYKADTALSLQIGGAI